MSGADQIVVGSVTVGPAPSVREFLDAYAVTDSMAKSIVHLLTRLAEVEAERDFYRAAASKLMSGKPHNGRRKK